MNSLYLLFFCINLLAETSILTTNSIAEELQNYNNTKVNEQRPCFERNKFNAFFIVGVESGNPQFKEKLLQNINEFIKYYKTLTSNNNFKITSTVNNRYQSFLKKPRFLNFFRDSYIINRNASEVSENTEQLNQHYEYFNQQKINTDDEMQNALKTQQTWSSQCGLNRDSKRTKYNDYKYADILLIDNVLSNIEDYELFYTDLQKIERKYAMDLEKFKPDGYKPITFIFIILKLDKIQKQKFWNDKPWQYFNITDIVPQEGFNYLAFFLKRRTFFGNLLNTYVKVFSLGSRVRLYDSNDIGIAALDYKRESINISYEDRNSIISFLCGIHVFNETDGAQYKLLQYKRNIKDPKSLSLKVVRITMEQKLFYLEIFYIEKLIKEKSSENKKIYYVTVTVIFGELESSELLSEYSYYKKIENEKIKYSFSLDNLPIDDNITHEHSKVVKLVENIKKHINKSFMHYGAYFKLEDFTSNNNTYVDYYEFLSGKKVKILWDYQNQAKFLFEIMTNVKKNFNVPVKFVLYKYQIDDEKHLYQEEIQNYIFDVFYSVNNLTKLNEDSVNFSFDKSYEKQNICLQICLSQKDYTQYYYIFLPVYVFQFTEFVCNIDYKKTFLDHLKESKTLFEGETIEQLDKLYMRIIQNIVNLQSIPESVIQQLLCNMIDKEFDYFIYTVLAEELDKDGYLDSLGDMFTDLEKKRIESLKIPLNYNNIRRNEDDCYQKIIENDLFSILYENIQNALKLNFKKTASEFFENFKKSGYQYCYVQCGNKYENHDNTDLFMKILQNSSI
ncbi:hypothetical protein COBT_000001 [Conglomerata obtusa]